LTPGHVPPLTPFPLGGARQGRALAFSPTPASALQDGRHGKAYGRLTWWGQPPAEDQPHRRLHGPLKKKWTLLEAAAGAGVQAPRHVWQQSPGFFEAVAALKQQQQQQQQEAGGAAAEGGEVAAPPAQNRRRQHKRGGFSN
jgi:hypothetical protein